MMDNQILQNGDRNISYRLIGKGKRSIVFFHGFPGSSAQIVCFERFLDLYDLQVLCVDRPGYGDTTDSPKSGPIHLDNSVQDILYVLKYLKWTQYETFAVSGGTPFMLYGLLTQKLNPIRATIVCGLAPLNSKTNKKKMRIIAKLIFHVLPKVPPVFLKYALQKIFNKSNVPLKREGRIFQFFFPLSQPDHLILKRSDIQKPLQIAILEAFKQNGRGPICDAVAYTHFSCENTKSKISTKLYHGEQDLVVPLGHGLLLQNYFEASEFITFKNEGHYSLVINRMGEILKT